MNPHDHVKYRVRDIVRRALFDFVQHTNANPLTGAADEVENTAVGVVGLLDRDGLIAYPTDPGEALDPADPIDAALLVARDVLHGDRVGDASTTVTATVDGTVTITTTTTATVAKGA